MKLSITALGLFLALTSALLAVSPSPITTVRAIHALNRAEVEQAPPVVFEATVVYSRGYENLLFVQDGEDAIFVRPPTSTQWAVGDRVQVRGRLRESFRPLVVGESVILLHHGPPPVSTQANFDKLIRAQHDCQLVTVHGFIRAADLVVSPTAPVRSSRLQLLADGGHFEANLDTEDANGLKDLLDAEVEITGAAAGKFDDKMQQTGIVLYVSSLSEVKVLRRAGANPWSLPITPWTGSWLSIT